MVPGSGSLVVLLQIAQVGSHGNGADVPLVRGSNVLHHIAEVGHVGLHRAGHYLVIVLCKAHNIIQSEALRHALLSSAIP